MALDLDMMLQQCYMQLLGQLCLSMQLGLSEDFYSACWMM